MPKMDTTRLRVGTLLLKEESLKQFQEKGNPWDTFDLNPPPPGPAGFEAEAFDLWKGLNELGLHAVVVEIDWDLSARVDYAILGWALSRGWHVIVIEHPYDDWPFLLAQLPWVMRVVSVEGALLALEHYVKLRDKMATAAEGLDEPSPESP